MMIHDDGVIEPITDFFGLTDGVSSALVFKQGIEISFAGKGTGLSAEWPFPQNQSGFPGQISALTPCGQSAHQSSV